MACSGTALLYFNFRMSIPKHMKKLGEELVTHTSSKNSAQTCNNNEVYNLLKSFIFRNSLEVEIILS
jgi:hypothetical protein